MIDDMSKKIYVPPRVVAVSFQVEDGFQASNGNGILTHFDLLPESSNVQYGAAANSGSSFWGGSVNSESTNSSYNSSWEWHW